MAYSREFKISVVKEVTSGSTTVAEAAQTHGLSMQSIRNWMKDPSILAAASGHDLDASDIKRPTPPAGIDEQVAEFIYMLLTAGDKDVPPDMGAEMCREFGVDKDEILGYGRELDKVRKIEKAQDARIKKRLAKAEAKVEKLQKRLEQQQTAFKEIEFVTDILLAAAKSSKR